MCVVLNELKPEDNEENRPEGDAVIAEEFEVVLADVIHKKGDDAPGDQKGNHKADAGGDPLAVGEMAAVFHQTVGRGGAHGRDGEEKGVLDRHFAGCAEKQSADDRRRRARRPGDHRETLDAADQKGAFVGEAGHVGHLGFGREFLNKDEEHAANHQRGGDRHYVKQGMLDLGAQQAADDQRRDHPHRRFEPDLKHVPKGRFVAEGRSRKQLFMEINQHGQNGPELDDHHKHIFERLVKVDEFIDDDHVSGTADRQKFGHALDDAQQHGFKV